MNESAIHPFDPTVARPFVQALTGEAPPSVLPGPDAAWNARIVADARAGYDRLRDGHDRGAFELTAAFGQLLAAQQPTFSQEGLTLTAWEARVERGAGMLLRPPARLFIEAGLDPAVARRLPIRIDPTAGMMGGAFVPPHLVPRLGELLEARFDRIVKRLAEAEMDALAIMAMATEIVRYAEERGLGLFETAGVVLPDEPATLPPGGRLIVFNPKRVDPALRKRVEHATKAQKEPGVLSRLFGRGRSDGPPAALNGHGHDDA